MISTDWCPERCLHMVSLRKRRYFHLLLCQFHGIFYRNAFDRLKNPFAGPNKMCHTTSNEFFNNLMSTSPAWSDSVSKVPNQIRAGQNKLFLVGINPCLGEILHSVFVTYAPCNLKFFPIIFGFLDCVLVCHLQNNDVDIRWSTRSWTANSTLQFSRH